MTTLKSDVGNMLAMLVHDLRNPTATLTANVDFLAEIEIADPDGKEALDDLRTALQDIKAGLTRVSWIADGFLGRGDAMSRDGDVAASVIQRYPVAQVQGENHMAKGGATFADVVAIFVESAERHDRRKTPELFVIDDGDGVIVRVDAHGAPLREEFNERAFTLEGQEAIKGKAGGRYARYCGLLAASSYVEALGGTITPSEFDGRARTELRLPRP
ncbi:MAG: hypothetical protein ACI9KE_002940 [Polyangiales bacterium]|jgi:hypothetical protein